MRLALLFFFLGSVLAQDFVFNGIIPSSLSSTFNDLFSAYALLKPNVDFQISLNSSQQCVAAITSPSQFDFGIASMFNDADATKGVQFFPFMTTAIVPQYNIPNVADGLVFSRPLLSDIFSGVVTNWQDPQIVNLNPTYTLPNANITIVYRKDITASTLYFTQALDSFSPSWTYGANEIFPLQLQNETERYIGGTDTLDTFSRIVITNYSIGYTALSFFTVKNTGVQLGSIINRAQKVSDAVLNDIWAAQDQVEFDHNLRGSLVDLPGDSWPISGFYYLVVRTNLSKTDCKKFAELYKFFHWILTSSDATNRMTDDGTFPLSANLSQFMLQQMSNIQCGGNSVLSYEDVGHNQVPAGIFVLVLNLLLFISVLIFTGFNLYHFSRPLINAVYSIIFLIGSILVLSAPNFYFTNPDTSYVCMARVWCFNLGFCILLGTMFCRTWQLREIYLLQKRQLDALRYGVTLKSSFVKLVVSLCTILVIDIIFLIVWSYYDPSKATFVVSDELDLKGSWGCHSRNDVLWEGIQFSLLIILILWGLYVIYQTWSFQRKALIVETKWVLIALYNIVMAFFVLIPILGLDNLSDDDLAVAMTIIIDFASGSIIFAVLLPRLVQKLELSTHGSESGGKKEGGSGKSKQTKGETAKSKKSKERSKSNSHDNELYQSDDEHKERARKKTDNIAKQAAEIGTPSPGSSRRPSTLSLLALERIKNQVSSSAVRRDSGLDWSLNPISKRDDIIHAENGQVARKPEQTPKAKETDQTLSSPQQHSDFINPPQGSTPAQRLQRIEVISAIIRDDAELTRAASEELI